MFFNKKKNAPVNISVNALFIFLIVKKKIDSHNWVIFAIVDKIKLYCNMRFSFDAIITVLTTESHTKKIPINLLNDYILEGVDKTTILFSKRETMLDILFL